MHLCAISTTSAPIFGNGLDMEDVVLNGGDTAWMLASTALVLLMTPRGVTAVENYVFHI